VNIYILLFKGLNTSVQ